MSELRKANTDDLYFITLVVVGWIDIFTRKACADIIVENLNYCVEHKGLEIFYYCIMPSHIHMICRSSENCTLSPILRDFKSYTAKQIIKYISQSPYESRSDWLLYLFEFFAKRYAQNKKYIFWQKTNHPTCLYTNGVIDQKVNYIHNNPVAAGIVCTPEAYVYSSLNPQNRVILSQW